MNHNNNNPNNPFDTTFVDTFVVTPIVPIVVPVVPPIVDTPGFGSPVASNHNNNPITGPILSPSLQTPIVPITVAQSVSTPLKVPLSPLIQQQSSCPRSPPLVPKRNCGHRKLPQRPASSLSSRTPSPLIHSHSSHSSSSLTPGGAEDCENLASIGSISLGSVSLSISSPTPSFEAPLIDTSPIRPLRGASLKLPKEGVESKMNGSTTTPPVGKIETKSEEKLKNGLIKDANKIDRDANKIDRDAAEADAKHLHKYVFQNDISKVSKILKYGKCCDINIKDKHGNTPLHLACMLGHHDITELLLSNGALIKVKNLQGWTPLSEAVSYGSRSVITMILRELKKQSRENIESRRPELIRALELMGNFTMEVKWDFVSWIPLVSRILPSDICKIYKKGSSIRCDTTLVDFSDMKWDRGDVSFIFVGSRKDGVSGEKNSPKNGGKKKNSRENSNSEENDSEMNKPSLVVLDNKLKVFQYIRTSENDSELEDEVDLLMSSDIVSANMSTKNIEFSRTLSGWLFKSERTEMIGTFLSKYYSINGFYVESKKRREHLSEEDLIKNKQLIDTFTKGGNSSKRATPEKHSSSHKIVSLKKSDASASDQDNDDNSIDLSTESLTLQQGLALGMRRRSLDSIPNISVSYSEYENSDPGNYPNLGRPQVCKSSTKSFKAMVAMSADFPMTLESLLSVLEIIQPFKQFKKLKEFIQMKLPPGFPVKIDIPILPTVTAKITFQDFKYDDNMEETLFSVPSDYVLDPSRFPDL